MSKKDIRKKLKNSTNIKDGYEIVIGNWLKRYFYKNTTKRKHKIIKLENN